MKYITPFMLGTLFIITSCSHAPKVLQVDYVCPNDMTFTVQFDQNNETATLHDQADRIFILKQAPAASGAFYRNDDGVSIHSKADDAIIELVKGKPIQCTAWKGN